MIESFKHKGLRKFYETGSTAGIQAEHAERLQDLLTALDTAQVIDDMDLPTLELHPLKGRRKNQPKLWAITVRSNWRITFEFVNNNAQIVNYEDYH